MARPFKFDRKEAIELAMNEIWRDGYEANSVKALSEKLGITRSSFYNAFGSREALFCEALELYASRSPDGQLADAKAGEPIKRKITDTFRTVCKVLAADPENRGCLAINGVAALCGTNDELGPLLEQAVLGRVTSIESLLGQAVEQNEIAADTDLHSLALVLQNMLMGLNVMSQVVGEEQELWGAAKMMLKGLDLLDEEYAYENV